MEATATHSSSEGDWSNYLLKDEYEDGFENADFELELEEIERDTSERDCWNLFKSIAFKDGLEDADPELVEIGRDIVNKCAGVPLAAKTLGGLCYQSDKQMWKTVRDSHVWKLTEEQNGIPRALKISYFHLPFYLKQCFAYCSLFPKGYEIQKDMLIQLWIAIELIHSSEGNQLLDDIGNEYIDELVKISFLQELNVDYCGNVIEFKMHNLVHYLAQSVSRGECFTVCKDKEENYHEGVRHLFFNIEVPRSPFETSGVIAKPSNIQTLIFALNTNFSLETICSSFMLLRVLEFRNDEIDQLPDSIYQLKHLRYLQIRCPRIKKLPESITNLQNLQVLKLGCKRLEKLPTRIQNMISLRHIILSNFIVSKDKGGCALNGLNELTNLGGELEIRNLEHVKNAEEIKETNLKNKKNLSELKLVWRENSAMDRLKILLRPKLDFIVLEKLKPHSNLKKLEIRGYGDVRFPPWMMECWFSLPVLKILKLSNMDRLRYIEEDRPHVQSRKECFSSLTELHISNCRNLESWFPAVEAQISFPSLVELQIYDCPKLKSVPHLVPSSGIKELTLSGADGESLVGFSNPTNSFSLFTSLRCSCMESWPNWFVGSHLPSLRELSIRCARSLPFLPQQIQHLPALWRLTIWHYREAALPEWMANITSSSLRYLDLYFCPNLKILPEWVLREDTTVAVLSITECPHLKHRYNKETGEDRHKIAHMGYTEIK